MIFLTAMNSDDDEERAFGEGIADYITKPLKPALALARVRSQLLVRQARRWLQDQNLALEAEVKAEIEAAVEFAKQSPYPAVDQVTMNVYANDNERSVIR